MDIPVGFVENISTYRGREYTCSFLFYSKAKNYGDKQMRIHQEPTTACETLFII